MPKILGKKIFTILRRNFCVSKRVYFSNIGAVMIAQWCQPTENIVENEIYDRLDALAEDVKASLAERHPLHPLVLITEIVNQGRVYILLIFSGWNFPCSLKK